MNAKQNTQPVEALTLSVTEAAALLGVNRTTIYRWIATEAIKTVRVGQSALRVRRRDVLALVEDAPVEVVPAPNPHARKRTRGHGVA